MSAAPENRWRRGGPQSQSQHQQRPSQHGASGQQQRTGTPTGRPSSGVWGSDKRSGGTGPGSAAQSPRVGPSGGPAANNDRPPPPPPKDSVPAPQPVPDKHIPMNGFNAEEVAGHFKKEWQTIVAGAGGEKELLYKPAQENAPAKSPWGSRPNQMAGGRDFFVELQKQIRALEEEQKKK